jgi:hypothetical protein
MSTAIAYEQLNRERAYVNDWNVDPTGARECSAEINQAIREFSRESSSSPTGRGILSWYPGKYKIDDTVLGGSDSAAGRSIFLQGKPGYANSEASGVILDATGNLLKPAVNLQGQRFGGMDGFLILGPNAQPQANSYPSEYTDDVADWITAGCADGRYAPQCGVAIDGWNGSTPSGGGYPGVTYASGTESAHLTISNVVCRGHVVGFMVNPSGFDTRADTLQFHT